MRTESTAVSRDLAELTDLRAWLADRLEPSSFGNGVTVSDILVMATELATNAVMHTASSPTLRLDVAPDHVRVAVHDDSPRHPVLEPIDLDRPSGNGLRIVDAWSERWGTNAVPGDGKEVWFTARRC